MRTSYSAIETYLQCPQKYKFQEIDRIKTPKSREALFGTSIHNALKFMFQRDPLFPTLEEVISHFREYWPSDEVFAEESKHDPLKRPWLEEEKRAYFEDGVRMLKKFYEKNAPWNFTVVDLESYFEVAVTDEKTGQIHILAGKIDRIDKLPDDTYEIIDYKTTKRMPSQDTLNRDLQLSLYSLGLQKRWPHLTQEEIALSLYFLKHGEKLRAEITKDTIKKTKEHILETINKIQARIASHKGFEPTPTPLCDWCGYRPMCPAWKHLYKKPQVPNAKSKTEIENIIKEYFELKKNEQNNKVRLVELQGQIKEFMAQEGVTRVFGKEGVISQKHQQRYEYDWEKIKNILSPLGKWEEILKADEVRLRKVMSEIPEEVRLSIENARSFSKEYIVLTTSIQTKNKPESEVSC